MVAHEGSVEMPFGIFGTTLRYGAPTPRRVRIKALVAQPELVIGHCLEIQECACGPGELRVALTSPCISGVTIPQVPPRKQSQSAQHPPPPCWTLERWAANCNGKARNSRRRGRRSMLEAELIMNEIEVSDVSSKYKCSSK